MSEAVNSLVLARASAIVVITREEVIICSLSSITDSDQPGCYSGSVLESDKTEHYKYKIISDINKSKTRVNIGFAFHCWRQLLMSKGMKLVAEFAMFLLHW